MMVDVIIPLGCESADGRDDELRILLRSIHRNLIGAGRVIIVSDYAPDWLGGGKVEVLPYPDRYEDNKDANLIEKTLHAAREMDLRSFVWCADDNVFMTPVRASEIPMLRAKLPVSFFSGENRFHRRIRNMAAVAKETYGINLEHSMESHAPQFFSGVRSLPALMDNIPWRGLPGVTIMTAFRLAMGDDLSAALPQEDFKETAESADAVGRLTFSRKFLGYNDAAFLGGLRDRLFGIFQDKSPYEL